MPQMDEPRAPLKEEQLHLRGVPAAPPAQPLRDDRIRYAEQQLPSRRMVVEEERRALGGEERRMVSEERRMVNEERRVVSDESENNPSPDASNNMIKKLESMSSPPISTEGY